MKILEELNQQLKSVKNENDLKQLLNDIINNDYDLIYYDKYSYIGSQYLNTHNYDITIDNENKNKFRVYHSGDRVNVRHYKTMYKYFTIQRPEIIAHNEDGTPCYYKGRYNIN